MRVMTLPNGKQCRLGTFVRHWRELKTLPPDTLVNGWEWYPMKASDILRAISAGVQDRINQRVPYVERGMK